MLQKTRGIALKVTNYAESSVVTQVFTEEFGLQSYLVNGARKPKAKIRANILQPFHVLDMVVYHKDNNSLQRISEARQSPILQEIPYDIVKSSLAMFLNEVLFKVLKQQSEDRYLFQFLVDSIYWLDHSQANLANYHIVFLLKLTEYLGFSPALPVQPLPYFDLEAGLFTRQLPPHMYVLQEPHASMFTYFLSSSYDNSCKLRISGEDRQILLENILNYYRLHLTNFGEVKSLYILEEIFK